MRTSQHRPAVLFNAMIAPLVPYTAKGAIWYQGESNQKRAVQYETLLPTMIKDWRAHWGDKDLSFYFRGPHNRLNLRAQNLMLFAQIAEGVDDETWEHHRRIQDYSGWFRRVIKDDELTAEAADAESDASLDPAESRRRIIEAIHRRYTAPARAPR